MDVEFVMKKEGVGEQKHQEGGFRVE